MLNLESWNGPSDQLSQDQLWPKGRGDCDEQDHWCLLDFVQQIKCVGRFLFYWSRSPLLPAGGKQDSVHDGIWSALHSDFGWLWGGGISACALCMETLFLNFGLVIYVSNLKLCLWSLLIVCACPDIWVRCQVGTIWNWIPNTGPGKAAAGQEGLGRSRRRRQKWGNKAIDALVPELDAWNRVLAELGFGHLALTAIVWNAVWNVECSEWGKVLSSLCFTCSIHGPGRARLPFSSSHASRHTNP